MPALGGARDAQLLVFGTIVGYSIIVSSIIFNYLTGASVSFLELIINTLAIILFIAVGGVSLEYRGNLTLPHCAVYSTNYCVRLYKNVSPAGHQSDSVAIGILSLLTALVFIVDLFWLVKHTNFNFKSSPAPAST